MSYVTLDNIQLNVKPKINLDTQINVVNKSYADNNGSFIRRRGTGGRKIELPVHVKEDQIVDIQELSYKENPVILISESKANYNGSYYITDIAIGERRKGIWDVTITLIEYIPPNIVRSNFKTWNRPESTETPIIPSTLSTCPAIRFGDRGACVTELQTYLKRCGYYNYYQGHSLAIDGYFGPYLLESVLEFQRQNNLPQNGIVDAETKAKMLSC